MICKVCKTEKELSAFYVRKETGRPRRECKPCWNARAVAWRAVNRDRVRGYVRKSCKAAYDADPEKFKEKSRRLRQQDPIGKREIVRRSAQRMWATSYTRLRAYQNAFAHLRRAALRAATPGWLTAIHRAQIQEMYDIAKCREVQTGIEHHVDHIMPIKGKKSCGLHTPWNLQILTKTQNLSKSNKELRN